MGCPGRTIAARPSINGEFRAVVVIANNTCCDRVRRNNLLKNSPITQVAKKNRKIASRMKGKVELCVANSKVWQEKMQKTSADRAHGTEEPANFVMDLK